MAVDVQVLSERAGADALVVPRAAFSVALCRRSTLSRSSGCRIGQERATSAALASWPELTGLLRPSELVGPVHLPVVRRPGRREQGRSYLDGSLVEAGQEPQPVARHVKQAPAVPGPRRRARSFRTGDRGGRRVVALQGRRGVALQEEKVVRRVPSGYLRGLEAPRVARRRLHESQ